MDTLASTYQQLAAEFGRDGAAMILMYATFTLLLVASIALAFFRRLRKRVRWWRCARELRNVQADAYRSYRASQRL